MVYGKIPEVRQVWISFLYLVDDPAETFEYFLNGTHTINCLVLSLFFVKSFDRRCFVVINPDPVFNHRYILIITSS
jgi:hypothetical protein